MMGMELSLVFRQIQTRRCAICGAIEGHNPGCPIEEIKKLWQLNRYIKCPNCNRNEIGLNRKDVYECRICHTQYCRRPINSCGGCVREEWIDDPENDDIVLVYELKEKGIGDFPLDKKMEELQEQIKKIKEQIKKTKTHLKRNPA